MMRMKFNPGFLTDEQLVTSFCVREQELESIVETLREDDSASSRHRLVIGPRGSGKTTLLLRATVEIGNDPELSNLFFPVVFAEETYGIGNAADFWLEVLSRLEEQLPSKQEQVEIHETLAELRILSDEGTLERRCLAAILELAERLDRRFVLIVENMDMMFTEISDKEAGWHLRHTLQTEPRIVLIGGANSRFDDIDKPDRAFYDLFTTQHLRPLNQEECAKLWRNVSGQDRIPSAMRGLEILTGGNPRLLSIIAQFGAKMSFRDLMSDLLALIDDLTDYFKSHIEAIPPQERHVYLGLAEIWEPATTREIARRVRLDTSKCSAFLKRLIGRGAVESVEVGESRKRYRVTQRLFNIYYLLRRSRTPNPLIEALVRFMDAYYSPDELQILIIGMLGEACEVGPEILSLHRSTLSQLIQLPSLAPHRGNITSRVPMDQLNELPGKVEPADKKVGEPLARSNTDQLPDPEEAGDPALDAVQARIREGIALERSSKFEEAIRVWDEAVEVYGNKEGLRFSLQVARAMYLKALTLGRMERFEEQVEAFALIARSYSETDDILMQGIVALSLVDQGTTLREMNRLEQASSVFERVRNRYASGQTATLKAQVARASLHLNVILAKRESFSEALTGCDQLIDDLWQIEYPEVETQLFDALALKADIFGHLRKLDKAIATCDEIVRRFEQSPLNHDLAAVGEALTRKSYFLERLGSYDEVIAICEDIYRRFASQQDPSLLAYAVEALGRMGFNLGKKGDLDTALGIFNELINRYGDAKDQSICEEVATAFFVKSETLCRLDRPHEAISNLKELDTRFEHSGVPDISFRVGQGLVRAATALGELGKLDEEIEVLDEILLRYGVNSTAETDVHIARALLCKGHALQMLHRSEEEIACYEEVVRRFDRSTNPQITRDVASALLLNGNALQRKKSHSEAVAKFRKLKASIAESKDPELLSLLAQALFNEAGAHFALEDHEQALSVCGEILERFDGDEDTDTLDIIADTLLNKSILLRHLQRPVEAHAVHTELDRRFGECDNPTYLERVATSHIRTAIVLLEDGRSNEATQTCEDLLKRFARHDGPELQQPVAKALFIKGNIHFDTHQYQDAIDTFEEIVQRFSTASDPDLQVLAVRALIGKAGALYGLDDREQAVALCEQVFNICDSHENPEISLAATEALVERGKALIHMGRMQEANESFEQAIDRTGEQLLDGAGTLRVQALVYQTQVLQRLGKPAQAAQVWHDLTEHFNNDAASSTSDQLMAAYWGKASQLAEAGMFDDAIHVCDEAIGRTHPSGSPHHEAVLAKLSVLKGTCLLRLGHKGEAEKVLRVVIEQFAERNEQEFQVPVVGAALQLAQSEAGRGNHQESLALLELMLVRIDENDEATRCHCHLVRAQAHLGAGSVDSAEEDIQMALSIGFTRNGTLGTAVNLLIEFATLKGFGPTLRLIESSPSRDALYPLVVAFRKELGQEVRVAQEFEQVAEDIRQKIAEKRRGPQAQAAA